MVEGEVHTGAEHMVAGRAAASLAVVDMVADMVVDKAVADRAAGRAVADKAAHRVAVP